MAIILNDSGGGGDFTPVPTGTHFAVCDMVVDLGRQAVKSQLYGDSVKNQVYIRWQIPGERIEWEQDGEKKEGPVVIGKTYTASLGEKANLRKDLQSWRGKTFTPDELRGFDVSKLLGVGAMLSVTHTEKNGKTYANVAAISGIPKGMTAPPAEGKPLLYDPDNADTYGMLPKWLREKIDHQVTSNGNGANGSHDERNPPPHDTDLDDDVPF